MITFNVAEAIEAGALELVEVHGAPSQGYELYRSPEIAPGIHAGVDVLVVPPNAAFPIHTHPGHHVLYIVRGTGTIMYEGVTHDSRPGDFAVIPGETIHNVAAGPDGQIILSFGAPHHKIDSHTRMTVLETAAD